MQQPMKQQSFLQGAGILAIAIAVTKVIGAFYKIPLNNTLGADGYTYFLQTYDVYALLLTISTVGLPVAISRMVASAQARGNLAQMRRVHQASNRLFFLMGMVGTLFMVLLSKPLASLVGIPDGSIILVALGPAVLFVCLNSSFRGFFQGQSIMTPTAVSQIIEAACKLVLGLGLAFAIKKATNDTVLAVAGAILGVTIGSLLAFFYLLLKYRKNAPTLEDHGATRPTKSVKATIRELLSIAIPITLGSAGLQVISVIDSSLIMHRLQSAAGLSYQAAKDIRGLYGTAQTLFGLPSAFASPFAISVIPAITGYLAMRKFRAAQRVESSGVRIMTLLILPCSVGMGVLATPIVKLLYSAYSAQEAATTGALLSILSAAVILNCLVLLLNAILQAHGFVSLPVANMIIGGIVKVVINYILVGMPQIGIYGAPIGTVACFFIIAVLDIFCLGRVIARPPKVLRLMVKPFVASALMGAAAYLSNAMLARFLSPKIACVLAILIAVAVYGVLVVCLRIITYQDCKLLPKGEQIARILKIR